MASNFLITLEDYRLDAGRHRHRRTAPRPGATGGQSLENWTAAGAGALTGPIVRGDVETVARHREAISSARPELLGFYDNLAERTREVAGINPETGPQDEDPGKPSELHELRERNRRDGTTVGLVRDQGYLHEGHPVARKAARAGAGLVVMSLFVNPTSSGRARTSASIRVTGVSFQMASARRPEVDVIYAPSR